MISVKFPGANIEIGKGQPEYNVLHAMQVPGVEGELIICFEFTTEEVQQIVSTHKIYYKRWTFGSVCDKCGARQGFLPMKLQVELHDDIELTSPDPLT